MLLKLVIIKRGGFYFFAVVTYITFLSINPIQLICYVYYVVITTIH